MITDVEGHEGPTRPEQWKIDFVNTVIEYWRPRLFLDSYTIRTRYGQYDCTDDGCLAHSTTAYPYHYIRLTLHDDFWCSEMPLWGRERAIVHELIHRITIPLKGAAHELLSGHLVTWRDVKDRDEGAVDWVTSIVFESDGGLYSVDKDKETTKASDTKVIPGT